MRSALATWSRQLSSACSRSLAMTVPAKAGGRRDGSRRRLQATKVYDDGDVQGRQGLQVGVGRLGMGGRAIENPAPQPSAACDGIVAIVAKIVDALEGQMSGHGRLITGPGDNCETVVGALVFRMQCP